MNSRIPPTTSDKYCLLLLLEVLVLQFKCHQNITSIFVLVLGCHVEINVACIHLSTIIPRKVKQSYNVIHDGDYSDNAYIPVYKARFLKFKLKYASIKPCLTRNMELLGISFRFTFRVRNF